MLKERDREKGMVGIRLLLVCIWIWNPSYVNGATNSADGKLRFGFLAAFLRSFWWVSLLDRNGKEEFCNGWEHAGGHRIVLFSCRICSLFRWVLFIFALLEGRKAVFFMRFCNFFRVSLELWSGILVGFFYFLSPEVFAFGFPLDLKRQIVFPKGELVS